MAATRTRLPTLSLTGSSPPYAYHPKAAPFSGAVVSSRQSIAATASISISQPGRARRLTTTSVLAGGFSLFK